MPNARLRINIDRPVAFGGFKAPRSHGVARSGSAGSSEAQTVQRSALAIVEQAELSQALFGVKAIAISKIWALVNECRIKGWDGEDAEPINHIAATQASDFIRALPAGIPLPEFVPEPDGSISLDWIESRNRLFSVSVGLNNRFAYAWLDGTDRGHAVARFDGMNIPPQMLAGICTIIDHEVASLRASCGGAPNETLKLYFQPQQTKAAPKVGVSTQ